MKLPQNPNVKFSIMAAAATLGFVLAMIFFWNSPTPVEAQNTPATTSKAESTPAPPPADTIVLAQATPNAAPSTPTNAPAQVVKVEASTNQVPAPALAAVQPAGTPGLPTALPGAPAALGQPGAPVANAPAKAPEPLSPTEEVPVSFQGAQVDMIVQWLAKTTGKSVVKHPRVQCQLTIVSSKNLPMRDAVNLIYRALALEGFVAIESSKSILIVPEGSEPKMNPELLSPSKEIPEGRQRLMKVFPLKHVAPGELREKIRPVLSEKAVIDADERAGQLIVTDYNDNLRLLVELIKELDVTSVSDSALEIFTLKYSQAEDLASLLGLILNAQPGTPTSSSPSSGSSSPSPSSGRIMPGMPGGPGGPPSMPSSSGAPSAPLTSQAGQQVKIWPDKTANRLIVAAPKSRMPDVKKMIETLDTDKPEDVGVRVIPLKVVSAEDLVRELGPLYQKMSGKSLKDMVEVTASSRANSLIVLSSEANYKAIDRLIKALDTEDAQEKVMQAFPLKNADAEDVAKQLKDLSQDAEQSRYPYYYYSFSQSSSSKSSKKPSVVADRRRNTVIIQAPPGMMGGLAKMIQELDAPNTDNSLAPKIIALKFVGAADIEDVLNELFLKKTQQRTYWYYDDYPQETADKNVGRLYGKVRITSEAYSNSLIVTANSLEHLAAVEDVIKQLDVPSQAGESTLRLELRFASAADVANSLNILFAKNGSPPLRATPQQGGQQPRNNQPQQQDQNTSLSMNFELEEESKEEGYFPWLGGQPDNTRTTDGRTARPGSDMVGRIRVVPDQRSNSLLISANAHYLTQILKLIDDLDAPTAEVLIEARIVEVSSDFLDKLGVRWSPDGSKTFSAADLDNAILARTSANYTKGFGGTTTANTTGAGGMAAALSSLRSGVLDASISMDFLIQFLRQNTAATVLAQPQINIKDNETGKLFVGQEVPVPANNQINQLGGQNTSFRYKPVGVVLEVTPHINKLGDVSLKIHAESSSIVPGQIVLGGAVFDTRNFKTDLEAKSGETLVLGGIIQKQTSDTMRKTPILGSIPGLGWAFKKKDKVSREVELIVFLRPKVVRTPQEAKELLDEIDKKTPLIKKANQEEKQESKK
jgi:type II secretion system protein D